MWGNITSGGSSGIGAENPFRYRGYYYDNETGFYYLQSRYYDPEICRFISADNLEIIPTLSQSAGQLNLYAYCNNNPLMYTDESGESIILSLLLGGLIGATIAGAFNAIGQLCSGNSWDWAFLGLSLAGGFVSGFISAIPVPSFAALGLFGKVLSYGTTFVLGGTGAVVGGLITGSVNSLEALGFAFAVGGVANVIARGVTEKIVNVKASKIFNQSNKAKSLAVQKLQGHPLNMGAKALKGNMRNAFKGVTQKEIANLLMKANPYLRLVIYSAISSSVLSGWY